MMRVLFLQLICFLFVPLSSLCSAQETDPQPPPPEIPEYHRYRVSLRIALSPSLHLSTADRERLLERIGSASGRFWGACWDVTAVQEHRFQPATSRRLADFTQEEILAFEPDLGLDKLFLVVVEPELNHWRISARELDRRSRLVTAQRSLSAADIRELPESIVRLCSDLFRPIVRIEEVAGKSVFVRLLGGALIPPDPNLTLAQAGSLWLPLSRTIPSKQHPEERIQLAPWTYLKMESPPTLEETLCKCEIISGIRNSIPSRRSMRVETIALAIRPTTDSTMIRMIARGGAKGPLAAYDVDLKDEADQFLETVLSDRSGRILLSGSPDQPLKWLQIRSGPLKLAHLPIVPGVVPEAEIQIPSDAPRLKVEAQLAVLQSHLMELVVQRALLMRHLKRIVDEEKWDQVDPVVEELRILPTKDALRAEVTAIRVSEMKAAQTNNDRLSARRIEKICNETLELIDRHLDQEKIKEQIELSIQLRDAEKKKAVQMEENPEMDLKNLTPKK